jgi:hypothetical protein
VLEAINAARHVCVYVCVYVCMNACLCVCACVRVCVYVCVYTYHHSGPTMLEALDASRLSDESLLEKGNVPVDRVRGSESSVQEEVEGEEEKLTGFCVEFGGGRSSAC